MNIVGRIAALGLAVAGLSNSAGADEIPVERGHFTASRAWFQFPADIKANLYRSYAGFILNGDLAGFPNLFVMNCRADGNPFLTIHFPENYALTGFHASEWLPETKVFVRIDSGTLRFDAELNKNEFYIDFDDAEFDGFYDIWAATSDVDFKLGPANASVSMNFAPLESQTVEMLKRNGQQVSAQYSFLEMRTRCHATSLAAQKEKNWKVYGSVNCETCEPTNGKTYTFITATQTKAGKPIKTAKECETVKSALAEAMAKQKSNGNPLVGDFLCVGNGSWR